jgi:peroxiredoxin
MASVLESLPNNLPVPMDDGACDNLLGVELPNISLLATNGEYIDLGAVNDRLVIYCYPMTGRPDVSLPEGWEQIPGARGCTPQACSFRDHYNELKNIGTTVFGLSTQANEYQKEAKERLHLPFELLSDENLVFANALSLPVMKIENMHLLKRLTLIFDKGKVVKYFYPVFPPDKNIDDVIAWLKNNA